MPGRAQHESAVRSTFDAGDPRSGQDGIGWITRAIFPDERLRLAVHSGPPPLAAAACYAIVPSLERARFLLPLASRRVIAASVLAYNALRPPKVRAGRAAIGALARFGGLPLLRAPVLSVTAPPGEDLRELLLIEHLAAVLGEARLHAAVGIRPPDPHHKPTMQLFDEAGRPRGYAKIGWNDATRLMVRAEADALRALPRPGGDFPDGPRLTVATRWRDREIAIIEPMPRGVRRVFRPETPRAAAMLAVARRGGPPAPALPLRGSAFLARWRARAAGAPAIVATAIDALEARDGEVALEFGDWHGDWVPWNLARCRGRLLAWDWENRASDVPVGFDLAHQAFQIALSTHRRPAAVAADAAATALRRHGAALGLGHHQQRFVADAYLVELWLRAYELHTGGGGWNARLHPALLHVLADRLGLAAPAAG